MIDKKKIEKIRKIIETGLKSSFDFNGINEKHLRDLLAAYDTAEKRCLELEQSRDDYAQDSMRLYLEKDDMISYVPPLRWQKTLPKEQGYYWWRVSSFGKWCYPGIIHSQAIEHIQDMSVEFAGPIPKPLEEDDEAFQEDLP